MKPYNLIIVSILLLLLVGGVQASVTHYVQQSGAYTIEIFNGTGGNINWTPPTGVSQISVLAVAGGGGGATYGGGGGGGAGGVLDVTVYTVTPGTGIPIVVGAGGGGGVYVASSACHGTNGGDTTFNTEIIAKGGGGGAGAGESDAASAGKAGGSGGGSTVYNTAKNGGASTQGNFGTYTGKGYAGGANQISPDHAGGGGGATSIGDTATENGGSGFNASNYGFGYVAGGGGGAYAHGGTGGSGVGGNAGGLGVPGYAGAANTGSGGGAHFGGDSQVGGAGSSGIVIIKYLTPPTPPTASFTTTNISVATNSTSRGWEGYAPFTMQFTNTSTGADQTNWVWNYTLLGSTTNVTFNSTSAYPIYTFSSSGNYTIKLNVTNASGSSLSAQTTWINVSDAPVPSMIINYTASKGGVFNGGFETGTGTATASGWIGSEKYGWLSSNGYTAYVMYDANVSHTGSKSIKINVTTSAQDGIINVQHQTGQQYYMPIKPSTTYKFTFWEKTDNITVVGTPTANRGARLRAYKSDLSAGALTLFPRVLGTTDWTQYTAVITTESDTPYLSFSGELNSAIGTAWFDDITLEEVVADTQTTPYRVKPIIQGVTSVDNIDQSLDSGFVQTNTYALGTSISESAGQSQVFTPTKSKITNISFKIASTGTAAGWNITVHDASNIALSSNKFTPALGIQSVSVPALWTSGNLHFHIISTTTTGAPSINATTTNDMDTASYIQYYAKNTEDVSITVKGVNLNLTSNGTAVGDATGILSGAVVDTDKGTYTYTGITSTTDTAKISDVFMATNGGYTPATFATGIGVNGWALYAVPNPVMLIANTASTVYDIRYKFNTMLPITNLNISVAMYNGAAVDKTLQISHDNITWTTLYTLNSASVEVTPIVVNTDLMNGNTTFYLRAYKGAVTDYLGISIKNITANLNTTTTNATILSTVSGTNYYNISSNGRADSASLDPSLMVNVTLMNAGDVPPPPTPPTASFTTTNISVATNSTSRGWEGYAPFTMQFTNTSIGADQTNWVWNYTVLGSTTNVTFNSTSAYPIYTFETPGNYTIKLNATNASGSSLSAQTTWINVSHIGYWTTTNGSYTIIKWNATGSSTWTPPSGVNNIWYLVIAGGGAGGGSDGGGGGAGQFMTNINGTSITPTGTMTIVVGTGGTPSSTDSIRNGYNSTLSGSGFTTIDADGGGGGGTAIYNDLGNDGGSGGGGRGDVGIGGSSTGAFGNNGGTAAYNGGGGGGGAGAAGGSCANCGGGGGIGKISNITGIDVWYAGGGGGSGFSAGGAGTPTTGGGGVGATRTGTGGNGTTELGAGGGAGAVEGYGGSGVIIIKYLSPEAAAPVAAFTKSNSTGTAPLPVNFTDTSSNTPTSWNWSYANVTGNNTAIWFSQAQNPTMTFGVGNWSIRLNATNAQGTNTTGFNTSFVNVSSGTIAPVASFTANNTSGVAPITVMFNDTSSNAPTAWQWNATNVTGNNTAFTFSTSNNVTQVFGVGNFSIRLNASNSAGSNISVQNTWINVSTLPPVASFTANNTGGVAPITVMFNDTSSNAPTAWQWNATNATGNNTAFTFSTSKNVTQVFGVGNFSIKLNVSNAGGSNVSTQNTWVNVSYGFSLTADFSKSNSSGALPLPVTFTDTSIGSKVDTWNWSFGDGIVSSTQNPTHTYTTNNTYTVNLTVTNTTYGLASTKLSTVTVYNAIPVASFNTNNTGGRPPVTVEFTDTSSGSNISVWNWSFGDGNISGTINPIHTYGSIGVYTVNLTVTNDGGASSYYKDITVANFAADFSKSNSSGILPLPVNFNGTAVGSDADTWNWSFGDGIVSSTQNTTHVYTVNNTYTVNLTVTNTTYGLASTKLSTVIVYNALPITSFTPNNTAGISPLVISVVDTSSGSNITNWNWSWGDGNYSSSQSPAPHTYEALGTYPLSLTVTNDGGSNTSATQQIVVADFASTYSGSPSSGQVPLSVAFTETSSGLVVDHYYWDFGDISVSNTSTLQNPTHIYNTVGIYNVSHRITNDTYSLTNWNNKTNYIHANTTFAVDFTGSPLIGQYPGTNVNFVDNSVGEGLYQWNWSFGDGQYSDIQYPNHVYTTPGLYTVALHVWGLDANTTTTKTDYITITTLTDFTAAPLTTAFGSPIQFTDTSGGTPTAWNWSFGDGTYSDAQHPIHSYAEYGLKTVTLQSWISGYLTTVNTTTKLNYISIGNRTVSGFTADTMVGTFPLTVTFNVTIPNDNATTWNWSFGDGYMQNGTTQNATHTYSTGGIYTVSETANNDVFSNTTVLTNYITVWNTTTSDFSGTPTSGTIPFSVQFTGVAGNGTTYHWIFGDGNTTNNNVLSPEHFYNAVGTYSVNFSVSNAYYTNWTNNSAYITVNQIPAPVANFTTNTSNGMFPLAVKFTEDSTNTPASWNWSFGDGIVSTEQNPEYTYSSGGNYTVNLTVTNNGGSSSAIHYIDVWNTTTSTFTTNVTEGFKPVSVQFTDTSSNATDYYWSFGEGNTSITKSPAFTYNDTGVYTINHSASNAHWISWTNVSNMISVSEGAPVSSFNANQTAGFFPLWVQFTDTTTNAPSAWNWSFGDGTYSDVQSPMKIYSTGGVFAVILNATNTNTSAYYPQTQYITVYNTTVSGFTADTISGLFPLTVTFNVVNSNDNATTWNWSFGDGQWQNGTTQNATHTYSTGGIYTVSETANNTVHSNTTTLTNYITVYSSTVSGFTADVTDGILPLSVNFNVVNSIDNATMWNWSFGDGIWQNGSAQNASYIYSTGGTYTVKQVAMNANGGYNITELTDYITVGSPTTSGWNSDVSSGSTPLTVAFTDNSANATSWYWIFGDGNVSTTKSPTFTYNVPGVYSVNHSATNDYSTSWTNKSLYIDTGATPVAGYTADTWGGVPPLTVQFTDLSSNTPTAWNWSFGDGSFAYTSNPTHTFTLVGNYTVSLTASNAGGNSTAVHYITVANIPAAGFTGTPPLSGATPLSVAFVDTSSNAPTSWQWTFGDGTYSTEQNPTHAYSIPGTFNVTLYVSNVGGNSTFTRSNYIVAATIPVSAFHANATYAKAPAHIQFTDDSSGTPTSWQWTFGDGLFSTYQNPAHIYTSTGIYTVSLYTENIGGSNTLTKSAYITVADQPSTNFVGAPLFGDYPLTVSFTDTSTNIPSSWSWNFGNGVTSTSQNPTYTYTTEGQYTVTLTASNIFGTDTETKVKYIDSVSPQTTIVTNPVVVNASTYCAKFYGNNTGTDPLTVWFEYTAYGTNGKSFKTPNQTNVIGNFTTTICGMPLMPGYSYQLVAGADIAGAYAYGTNRTFTMSPITPHVTTTYETQVNQFVSDGMNPIALFTLDIWAPYLGVMGGLFFAMLVAFIFMNLVIKQRTVSLTVLLLIIIGSAMWAYLPVEFVQVSQMLIIAGLGGLLYWLFMKRR